MTSKAQNGKKPKLAHHLSPSAPGGSEAPQGNAGETLAAPKHKMSFAQHQHELQIEHTPAPMPSMETTGQHLKSDAQQRQQKVGARK